MDFFKNSMQKFRLFGREKSVKHNLKKCRLYRKNGMVGAAGEMPSEDMQRFQQLASLLYMNSDVQAYLMAEMQMQKTLADIFKILTEAAGIRFDVPDKQ